MTELLRAYSDADALASSGPDSVEARFELDLHGTGLEEVIRGHLAQLDQPARDVLGVLAVWGTDISAGDLASLLPGLADMLDGLLERPWRPAWSAATWTARSPSATTCSAR